MIHFFLVLFVKNSFFIDSGVIPSKCWINLKNKYTFLTLNFINLKEHLTQPEKNKLSGTNTLAFWVVA